MKTLILAAGYFGEEVSREIDAGREPRLDVFELAKALQADVIDYGRVRGSLLGAGLLGRNLGLSPGAAYLGFRMRHRYDAILTSGEDIGLPLSALLRRSSARCSHTMIAHTLLPLKKRAFFRYLDAGSRIDRILAYSSVEERLMIDVLGLPQSKVERIYFHADQQFFRPDGRPSQPDLICAAGQLLRDYDCLIEATQGLPLKLQIAAGSPWIDHPLKPRRELPANVTWGKLNRHELRELYARSAICVVPILQNDYQTGIATILEMMAAGKCVVATRTRGQTDTIVDGVTGVYVPPSDPAALRQAIQRLLANPEEARRIGVEARKFIEQNATLDLFVERVAAAVRRGHQQRFGSATSVPDLETTSVRPPS
jgi:glycosyltransferase involved in cell wall biosynthesis